MPVAPRRNSVSEASRSWRDTRATAGIAGNSRTKRRSEEHTSELQSQSNLVCRLLLEKKNQQRQRAEDVPEVEVLRRVVLPDVLVPELGRGEAVVDPVEQLLGARGVGGRFLVASHLMF